MPTRQNWMDSVVPFVGLLNLPLRRKRKTRRSKTPHRSAHTSITGEEREDKTCEVFPNVPQYVVVPPLKTPKKGSELQPRLVVNPTKNKLLMFRSSQRWSKDLPDTKSRVRAMPYVTVDGCISSNNVYYWKCTSTQWIASVSATVYQRLRKRGQRWTIPGTSDKVMVSNDLLMRIAIYYSLTFDTRFLTRTLECAKRNEGSARKMVYKYVRKVDDKIRFWYDQLASTGVNSWLQTRARRARDKSTNLLCDYRLIEVSLNRKVCHAECQWLSDLTNPWVCDGFQPNVDRPRLISIRN